MSLKMEVETAVHIASLNLKEMRQPGWVKYCISLFYTPKNSDKKVFPSPLRFSLSPRISTTPCAQCTSATTSPKSTKAAASPKNTRCRIRTAQSEMKRHTTSKDTSICSCWTKYSSSSMSIFSSVSASNQYIYFLLQEFKKISSFGARIRKMKNMFEYLPVCFDHFGTLALEATYHSTLMAFKFETNEDEQELIEKVYPSFESYF